MSYLQTDAIPILPIPNRIEWMPAGNVEALEDEEDDKTSEDELMLRPLLIRYPPSRLKKKSVCRESLECVRKTYYVVDASKHTCTLSRFENTFVEGVKSHLL